MSLRVWLQLNGDLKNQGLEDVTVINNGAVIDNDGKIGKCYTVTSNGNGILLTDYMNDLKTYIEYSMCAWIYMNSAATSHSSTILSSGNWNTTDGNCCFGLYNYSDGYTKLLIPNRGSWNTTINLPSKILINKWYHIAVTYNGTETKAYINGEYVGKSTSGGICQNSNSNNLKIGAATYTSSYTLKGKINDVRIYDHCLSPAEVKEISRGLVLHYKLSERDILMSKCKSITWNQLANVPNISESTKNGITCYSSNGYLNISTISEGATAATTFTNFYSETNLGFSQIKGHKYYSPNTLPTGVTLSNNVYSGGLTLCRNTIYTGKRGSSTQAWSLKISEGTVIVTPVNCPILIFDLTMMFGEGNEPTIEEFEEMFPIKHYHYDSGTIVDFSIPISDSSGYNNNGTITGELSLNSESPRYSQNTIFNTTSSHIRIDNLPSTLANDFSISWWSNLSTYSKKMPWCSANGNRLNFYNGLYWNTYNGSSNPIQKPGTTTIITAPSANVWHHFAMTGDGTTCKFYMDGELYGIAKTYQGLTATSILLNGSSDNNSTYHLAGAEMSDFRIYATALSEEDIRQLYKVSAKIDNVGNLHSYKFEEYNIGRELLVVKRFCYPYYTISGNWNNFSSEGMEFNSSINSAGTEYIEINPEGHEYIYDFTISVSDGNQFYIGFERYDENKTARNNNACTYVYTNKPGSDLVKRRYTGTVNLSTDGVNPCKYIRLRILNGWSGSDSDSSKLATVHRWSLREIPTSTDSKTKLLKQGVLKTDMLREGNTKTKVEKNLVTYVNELIEI